MEQAAVRSIRFGGIRFEFLWHSSHALDQKTHQAFIGTQQTRTMERMVEHLQLTGGQLPFPDHLSEGSVSCCNHRAPQRRKANQREPHREHRLVDGGSEQQRVSPREGPDRQDFQQGRATSLEIRSPIVRTGGPQDTNCEQRFASMKPNGTQKNSPAVAGRKLISTAAPPPIQTKGT